MGTNQNLLAISLKNYNESGLMDRLVEHYLRESIRNTMLKHEDIFKQQVHELHRLYVVQKMLMAELRSREVEHQPLAITVAPKEVADSRAGFWSSASSSLSHDTQTYHSRVNFGCCVQNQCNITQLLGSQETEDYSRTQKGFDLKLPAEEEEESDVQLTLSIGYGSHQGKPDQWIDPSTGFDIRKMCLSTPVRTERGEECSDVPASIDEESLRRPFWLQI